MTIKILDFCNLYFWGLYPHLDITLKIKVKKLAIITGKKFNKRSFETLFQELSFREVLYGVLKAE